MTYKPLFNFFSKLKSLTLKKSKKMVAPIDMSMSVVSSKPLKIFNLCGQEALEDFSKGETSELSIFSWQTKEDLLGLKKLFQKDPQLNLVFAGDLLCEMSQFKDMSYNFITKEHLCCETSDQLGEFLLLGKKCLVILLCSEESYFSFFKTVLYVNNIYAKVVVFGNKSGVFQISRALAEPLLLVMTPFAGRGRLYPQLHHLLKKLNYNVSAFSPYLRNLRYLQTLTHIPSTIALDQALIERVKQMDYFDAIHIHEWSTIKPIVELNVCKVIFLMRDPRDLINSLYWYTKHEYPELDTDLYLKKILKGYVRRLNQCYQYGLEWPSMDTIMEIFQFCKKNKNVHVVRFEDLHTNNEKTLIDILKFINTTPSLISDITSADLVDAAIYGSFEHQTNGEKTRGAHNIHSGAFSGSVNHLPSTVLCRRGVIGDWKSLFSQEITTMFQTKYKDQLQKLGYE